tara:strand:- start:8902 stop:9105 length:204 start_codon:yes stop_codon:yes gene_type:complete
MDIKTNIPLKCTRCGGAKYIDEPYPIFDTWYVDVVCIACGHAKDIPVSELRELISKLESAMRKKIDK